jgi:hypothetical protein
VQMLYYHIYFYSPFLSNASARSFYDFVSSNRHIIFLSFFCICYIVYNIYIAIIQLWP